MISTQEIITAYKSCRKNKRVTNYALNFELNWEREVTNLTKTLNIKTYNPGISTCFVITYPTVREIFAAEFKDRIVHHYLINKIEKDLDKTFIFDSYACRKTKGSIAGAQRLHSFLREISSNCKQNAYFLQLDIKSFFYSIDKNILLEIFTEKVNNLKYDSKETADILCLGNKIIKHDPTENYKLKGDAQLFNLLPYGKTLFKNTSYKGLAIGNLTSQFFANLYLNELDQFVKRELKIKYYLRYADDMILLSKDISQLKSAKIKIEKFLYDTLMLELKEEKTKYGSIYNGIDFLGYYICPNYILARNRVVSNLKKKLYYFNNGFILNRTYCQEEAVPLHNPPTKEELESICASINSLFGHLKWCNSYNLRSDIYKNHMGILNKYLIPKENLSSFNIKI